jgi:hypothetical protein
MVVQPLQAIAVAASASASTLCHKLFTKDLEKI